MSTVAVGSLSQAEKDKMVMTYAALMLHDGGVAITEDKLAKVAKASGNTDLEGYWPGLFAKALAGRDIMDLLKGGDAPAAAAADAPAAAGGDAPAAKKKEEKVEEEEEADVDMGGLFGDDY